MVSTCQGYPPKQEVDPDISGERSVLYICLALCNRTSAKYHVEIAQQAKIRKKDEFLKAFDPIIVEGSAAAYKGSGPDIQNKIRRVIEVWRQRSVFRPPVQDEIERALGGTDMAISSISTTALILYRYRQVPIHAEACPWRLAVLRLFAPT